MGTSNTKPTTDEPFSAIERSSAVPMVVSGPCSAMICFSTLARPAFSLPWVIMSRLDSFTFLLTPSSLPSAPSSCRRSSCALSGSLAKPAAVDGSAPSSSFMVKPCVWSRPRMRSFWPAENFEPW